ncbi:MAG: deoxyribonuclease IV [Spirochaetales bacterium]|nr:deoxyribonuclease IV [Spirochaetales bacterium]
MKKSNTVPGKLLIGAHLSAAGGADIAFDRAEKLGCTAMQIFLSNARQWKPPVINQDTQTLFLRKQKNTGIMPIAHASYLINCASQNPEVRKNSLRLLAAEFETCGMLGISRYVLHPGNQGGQEKTLAIRAAAGIIDEAIEMSKNTNTTLLLETTASPQKSIGGTFEDLKAVMDTCTQKTRLAVCLDTCHVFQAGWDIRSEDGCHAMFAEFDRILGLPLLQCIHLNDAKAPFGRGLDRHEHIGEGEIGLKAFSFIMRDARFRNVPKCIETPKSKDDTNDLLNLSILIALLQRKRVPRGQFKPRDT